MILGRPSIPSAPQAAAVASEEIALTPYVSGGGHHLLAKAAFRGDENYSIGKALCISNAELDRLNINHGLVSNAQQSSYIAFAKTGQLLTWDTMREIEIQALVDGGANAAAAESAVDRAIADLQAMGVSGPTRIPWGGR